jgi:predicted esterase
MTASTAPATVSTIAIGPSVADAAAVAILVHGRGRSAAEMRDLALSLDAPSVRFVLPEVEGKTWYPQGFMAPLADNEPALSRSLAAYAGVVDAILREGVAAHDIVLGGFSQGACLTAEFLVRHPRPYGAALIFTGGLIGPPGTTWPPAPALRNVPVYLTGSAIDEWVPPARVAETASVLEASGARVRMHLFEDRGHHVCDEEISAARELLAWWGANENARGRTARRAIH